MPDETIDQRRPTHTDTEANKMQERSEEAKCGSAKHEGDARLLAPGRKGLFGFLLTVTLGIIGAFAAPHLGQEAGWYNAGDPAALRSALVGAVIVLATWAFLFKSRNPTSLI